MVYKRVRGWTSGRSLPVLNFVQYPPGDESPNTCHGFAKSVTPPKACKTKSHQHCFGTFSEVLEIPSENPELSWKGSKIIGIFRKSSDINLIRNLEKLNNLTDLPRSICVNVRRMWIAFLSWSLLLEPRRLKFRLDHVFSVLREFPA